MLHSAFDEGAHRVTRWLVVALVGMGVVADAIGIAAILDRLMEYGTTPNRLAVLGGNLVFLGTLTTLLVRWFHGRAGDLTPERITRNVMNKALVVFMGWTATVLLVFPLIYGLGLDSAVVERFEEAAQGTSVQVEEVIIDDAVAPSVEE